MGPHALTRLKFALFAILLLASLCLGRAMQIGLIPSGICFPPG